MLLLIAAYKLSDVTTLIPLGPALLTSCVLSHCRSTNHGYRPCGQRTGAALAPFTVHLAAEARSRPAAVFHADFHHCHVVHGLLGMFLFLSTLLSGYTSTAFTPVLVCQKSSAYYVFCLIRFAYMLLGTAAWPRSVVSAAFQHALSEDCQCV